MENKAGPPLILSPSLIPNRHLTRRGHNHPEEKAENAEDVAVNEWCYTLGNVRKNRTLWQK